MDQQIFLKWTRILKNYPIVTKVEKDVNLNAVMSNSFGFGGTNATLVFEKV